MMGHDISYLRISKKEENLENQRSAIQKFVYNDVLGEEIKKGIEIPIAQGDAKRASDSIKFFWDEDVSGTVPMRERESWAQIIEYVQLWKPEKIYVYELSRLGRDTFETISIIKDIEEDRNVHIYSASPNEAFINQSDPMSRKLMMMVFLWMYESELKANKARTKTALIRVKEEGRKVGRPSWGFDRNPDPNKKGQFIPNIEEIQLAKDAIKLRGGHVSFNEIADRTGIPRGNLQKIFSKWQFFKDYPL